MLTGIKDSLREVWNDLNRSIYVGDLERSMFFMEQAIRQTIRDVDILTRYGEKSFLVILLGADSDGAKIATDRVFRGYYKMSGSGTYLPSYRNVLIK